MMRRRGRRRRLVRTVGRTAVVAGTATVVAGKVGQHQQRKESEQQQAAYDAQQEYDPEPYPEGSAAPPPAAPPAETMDDKIEALQKLAGLKDQGILTEEEFEAQKAKILGS